MSKKYLRMPEEFNQKFLTYPFCKMLQSQLIADFFLIDK